MDRPEPLVRLADRCLEIGVVRDDDGGLVQTVQTIQGKGSREVHVRALLFGLEDSNPAPLTWLRVRKRHRDRVGPELAEVNGDLGQGTERGEVEFLPARCRRVLIALDPSGEVPDRVYGVGRTEESGERNEVKPSRSRSRLEGP